MCSYRYKEVGVLTLNLALHNVKNAELRDENPQLRPTIKACK